MAPDTITVRSIAETELDADSADLHIVVEGSAVFSGNEAFKKAKELQELVAALHDFGIEESRVKLRNVRTTSQSFALFKSSSARYSITVSSVSIELLSPVLGAIAARKNAELLSIVWNYSQLKETRTRLRAQALADVKTQAAADATVLGVKLLGIHLLTESGDTRERRRESWDDDDDEVAYASYAGKARRKTSEIAFSLGNSKKVVVDIQVQFRVSPLPDA